jgi:DNA-binding NarL/FixJ family response regulator
MTNTKLEKIVIQSGNEIIELTGEAKQLFLTEMAEFEEAQATLQAQQDAKTASRQSALAKLAALGLTEEEIAAL